MNLPQGTATVVVCLAGICLVPVVLYPFDAGLREKLGLAGVSLFAITGVAGMVLALLVRLRTGAAPDAIGSAGGGRGGARGVLTLVAAGVAIVFGFAVGRWMGAPVHALLDAVLPVSLRAFWVQFLLVGVPVLGLLGVPEARLLWRGRHSDWSALPGPISIGLAAGYLSLQLRADIFSVT